MRILQLIAAAAVHGAVVYLAGQADPGAVQYANASLIGAAAIMGGAQLAGSMLGRDKTEQMPLETPEQKAARQMLLQFAQTGQFGDFKAGAEVPLGYGDYKTTGLEDEGLSQFQQLMRTAVPDQYKLGDAALRDILDTSPGALERQFEPFRAQTERLMRDSDDAVKRGAGYAGNLYSTDTIRKLGDVRARGNESMTAELARLSDNAINRRLAAVPLAMQSAQAQEGAALNRVAATQQYGGLTRRLNDAAIKARDAELLRRRTELQLPIQAAGTVLGSSSQFGVPSVETSPYQDLLRMVGTIGGSYLGNYAGARGAAAGGAAGADYGSYPANMGPSWNG